MVAPYGSYEPIFGTNPISIAIPRKQSQNIAMNSKGDFQYERNNISGDRSKKLLQTKSPLVLDMATSAAALFSLYMAQNEGRIIPENVAFDKFGNSTINPTAALDGGALRVFDNGHKGSHLAFMVEILAGALTGANMLNKNHPLSTWGSLVMAIDPKLFGPLDAFESRVNELCERVKGAKKLPGVEHIYLPGERGDEMERINLERGYIEMSRKDYEALLDLAK